MQAKRPPSFRPQCLLTCPEGSRDNALAPAREIESISEWNLDITSITAKEYVASNSPAFRGSTEPIPAMESPRATKDEIPEARRDNS